MIGILIGPFKYIAGIKPLLIGHWILFATGLLAYLSQVHFPTLISIRTSSDFPLTYYIYQYLVNWGVVSVFLYVFALFSSKSPMRAIDIFGTRALAQFPYLLASFIRFSGSIKKLGEFMLGRPWGKRDKSIILFLCALLLSVFATGYLSEYGLIKLTWYEIAMAIQWWSGVTMFVAIADSKLLLKNKL